MNAQSQSKKHLTYVDEAWFHAYGLGIENVLDYFAMSMFYDCSCNNHAIRTQGASANELLNMTGIEYAVEQSDHDPPVYIIKKQNRRSRQVVDVLEVYYVFNGVIYQSPSLMEIASTRVLKCALYLDRAFSTLISEHEFSASAGHSTLVKLGTLPAEEGVSSGDNHHITKPELILREFPSFECTVNDIANFCGESSTSS